MLNFSERKGHVRPIPQDELSEGKEKNQLPWIRKYLDLADKLIRREKRKDKGEDNDDDRPARRAA